MLVYLNVTDGARTGHRVWLNDNESVRVGHEDADFASPLDQLDDSHFTIRAEGETCTVFDNSSSSGTFVNRQRISVQAVKDGDTIQAGALELLVLLDNPDLTSRDANEFGMVGMLGRITSERTPPVAITYASATLPSGATKYYSIAASPSLADLLNNWQHPTYLIVNQQSLGWNAKKQFPILQDQPEIMPFLSLLELHDSPAAVELLQETAGKNSTMAIVSQTDSSELLPLLTPVATSFSHPSIWLAQAQRAPDGFRQQLLLGESQILLAGDAGHDWALYGDLPPDQLWQELGWANGPASPVEPTV